MLKKIPNKNEDISIVKPPMKEVDFLKNRGFYLGINRVEVNIPKSEKDFKI